jgi:hypothetical protein
MLVQTELHELSQWCIDHLSVDFNREEGSPWCVMTLNDKRVMRAYMSRVTNAPVAYELSDTDMAVKVVALWNHWKEFDTCS